ncbi:Polyprenal reductase [Caenorhabditis elegans]|uniref:Polyprenal reductase n=1 Tax=Caenorhabditis elegans TaxID=6239 RepID=SR5A3_CAEEL|nr:Polyprenol reductase [Caenorhabditis elegans]Q17428.2 RecName: Full=Polyprenol reductase [Caenorhabditis elegans]CAA94885.2 Polyprenol reductase [Caenorhabditis elegans]|eukprot:NP_001256209.1 Polyprenol reductase [Caenorhabditis elegans]
MLDRLWEVRQALPLYLLVSTLGLAISCCFTLICPHVCRLIPALTTYGKAADQQEDNSLVEKISVPKKWFKHFYAIGLLTLFICLHTVHSLIYNPNYLHPVVLKILATLTRSYSIPPITPSTSILALLLISLHVARRLYETIFVSVYSDSRMNLFHYAVGIVHYIILPISIMCETQGVASKLPQLHVSIDDISLTQWAGAVLFWICNWKQHQLAEQIANTRKGPRGLIRNYAYGICFGGWFNLVSCPHFLFEICIYLSLFLVIPDAYVYRFIIMFVCINQTFAALITHSWYHKTFPKYPKSRKALIPYVL